MGKLISEEIPNEDHLVRYCSKENVTEKGLSIAAFELRKTDQYLSVNWIEKVKGFDNRVERIIKHFVDKCKHFIDKGMKVKGYDYTNKGKYNGNFVYFNVGKAKDIINGSKITHYPSKKNISHAGIDYPPNKKWLEYFELEQIVAISTIYPVKKLYENSDT